MDHRELRRSLLKLGASEDKAGKHVYFFLEIDGQDHRVGKLSHSMRGQVPAFVISYTTKALRLTSEELRAVADCSLAKEDFVRIWRLRPV